MKHQYNVSTVIPLKTLVRAYELWCSTDMTQPEVARALDVDQGILSQAIVKAKRNGLYSSYTPQGGRKMTLDCIKKSKSGMTPKEIAKSTGLSMVNAQQSVYKLYAEDLVKRRRLNPTVCTYIYYI